MSTPPPVLFGDELDLTPAPPRSGRRLLIAAVAVGAAGGLVRLGTTIAVAHAIATGRPSRQFMTTYGFVYNPLLGTALALTGEGMSRRGKADAYGELFKDTPAVKRRRRALGWTLFGSGIGLWATTRYAGVFSACEPCLSLIWETGYYMSLALTVPGVIMGGYASGFHHYRKAYGRQAGLGARVTVSPIAHRDAWGLAFSGRF